MGQTETAMDKLELNLREKGTGEDNFRRGEE